MFRKTRLKQLSRKSIQLMYDPWLLFSTLFLVIIGLIMVASASLVVANRSLGSPFYFLMHQAMYLLLGFLVVIGVVRTPLSAWERAGGVLLLLSFALLIVVLLPGVGRSVNGSTRWLRLGPVGVQVSELVKLFVVVYLSGYLVRRGEEVRHAMTGFLKPLMVLAVISLLLLKQPDFGAATVILATSLGMMFLAGVQIWQFAGLLGTVLLALMGIAVSSPYRVARLTSFLDPWANQFDSGYQLTQSLIAFGRGGWLGVGLGASIQKLFYLPEAHTDFVLAVLGEELGLLGLSVVFILYMIFVGRAIFIGRTAHRQENYFSAYVAYGLGLWMGLQALINMGVNTGVLPTKGLTLPLISYGGSSMIVNCIVVALLLRIDHENRRTLI